MRLPRVTDGGTAQRLASYSVKTNDVARAHIYTRVATDQGLDQDFNSLDAHRLTQQAAATVHILLKTIEDRLPVWAFRKEGKIAYTRDYREPHQHACEFV